ncbi:hypothetical protein EV363DRAFT_1395276 [Boletus edulis]|uniref:Transcription activator of gluconeogenesis ERT1 n=1 Tax=Boletus edulis BED1 TaxID=1328754 RepID=A0AAD4GCV2_BOLED|nr:hypothetical protein EV363DRAFT_1395276 [Boletus edulis]KAF8436917.1 hypothetical protein L210DRAFT_3406415 [Boletus edulis BED1]
MTVHPVGGYSSMPMHMYPFPPGLVPPQPLRSKRRQVKNACTNCQKACKKCDDARPCLRCVKYGIAEECVDSQRKERKKGVKRGPYKKRDGKGSNVDINDAPEQQSMPIPPGMPPPSASPPMPPYMAAPVGYAAGFYGQFPAPTTPKPGEAPAYYPQFYITHVPPPNHNGHGQDGEQQGYAQPAQFYPATFLPYAPQPYGPYMVHPHRPDAQMAMAPQYAPFPQLYGKPPSAGGSHENGRSDHARGDDN